MGPHWLLLALLMTSFANAQGSEIPQLPDEIHEEILKKAQHPEEFGQKIRAFAQTNRHNRETIIKATTRLIQECARLFSLHPVLAALYIGTSHAIEFAKKNSVALTTSELSSLLHQALLFYTGSKQSKTIIQMLLDRGARVEEITAMPYRGGMLQRNTTLQKKLELYSCTKPKTLDTQWGNNGCSDELAGFPWTFIVLPDQAIMTAGTISREDSGDLFLQKLDSHGKIISRPNVITVLNNYSIPVHMCVQSDNNTTVIVVYRWEHQKLHSIEICLVNQEETLITHDTFTIAKQKSTRQALNTHSRHTKPLSFQADEHYLKV